MGTWKIVKIQIITLFNISCSRNIMTFIDINLPQLHSKQLRLDHKIKTAMDPTFSWLHLSPYHVSRNNQLNWDAFKQKQKKTHYAALISIKNKTHIVRKLSWSVKSNIKYFITRTKWNIFSQILVLTGQTGRI